MTRLYLVRHGEAAAGWGEDADPGLSPAGRQQAEAMAVSLAPVGPLPVVTSPLRRTRETAAALESAWGVVAQVDPAVGEVPSPTDDLVERMTWLAGLLPMPMASWPMDLQHWRSTVRDALAAMSDSAVVVTHYVAIRSAVGDDDYHPDYCSVTVVDAAGGDVVPVELGRQRRTVVR